MTSISILDSEGHIVKEVLLTSSSQEYTPRVTYARKSGNGLEFIWLGSLPKKQHECVLYKDQKFIWSGVISIAPLTRKFWIPLPCELLDGQEHCLGLGIRGFFNLAWSGKYLESQIAVSHSNNRGALTNYDFAGDRNSQRYRSLTLHFANTKDKESTNQIQQAHEYLRDRKKQHYSAFEAGHHSELTSSTTVVIDFPESTILLYDILMSLVLAYEKIQFEVIVLVDKDHCWKEIQSIFPFANFTEVDNRDRLVSTLITLVGLLKTTYITFTNKLQESCSEMLTSLCNYLDENHTAGVVCAKLLSNGSVIREAGVSLDENGEASINGLGQHWLTPDFSYCKEVDSVLDAPVCFRTNDLLNSLLKFKNDEASIAKALFKAVNDLKSSGCNVVCCSQALSFCAPGPLSQSEIIKLKAYPVKFNFTGKKLTRKDKSHSKRILMFDATTPTPDRDAGSYAALKEIELIKSLGFEITFVPIDLEYKVKYTAALQSIGVEVLYQPFFMQLQVVLNERLEMADAVYITRYNVAEKMVDYIKVNWPNIPIIFNNADLHFLREIRTALSDNNSDDLALALKTRDAELAVIKKADVVVSYSDAELAVITSFALRQDNLFKCPWVLKPKKAGKAFRERQGIAFLGGYKHLPNVAAVDFFVTQVMPLITAHSPHITLSIYGSNIPERFKLYESPNVKILGYIEDLDELFHQCRIFICPLISGAGIKGKVLESLSYGVPTVLSKTAAEGIGLIEGLTTLIADEPESWVRAINTLYEDESLWQLIAQNQSLLCDSLYSFEHGKKQMRKIFKFAKLL